MGKTSRGKSWWLRTSRGQERSAQGGKMSGNHQQVENPGNRGMCRGNPHSRTAQRGFDEKKPNNSQLPLRTTQGLSYSRVKCKAL